MFIEIECATQVWGFSCTQLPRQIGIKFWTRRMAPRDSVFLLCNGDDDDILSRECRANNTRFDNTQMMMLAQSAHTMRIW